MMNEISETYIREISFNESQCCLVNLLILVVLKLFNFIQSTNLLDTHTQSFLLSTLCCGLKTATTKLLSKNRKIGQQKVAFIATVQLSFFSGVNMGWVSSPE